MQSPSEIYISGMVDSNYKQLAENNPNALGTINTIKISGRVGTNMTISFVAANNTIYSADITIPDSGEIVFGIDVNVNGNIGQGLKSNNTSIMGIKVTDVASQADVTFVFTLTSMTSIYTGYTNL